MVLEYRASIMEDPQQAMAAAKENVEKNAGKRLGIAVYSNILAGVDLTL